MIKEIFLILKNIYVGKLATFRGLICKCLLDIQKILKKVIIFDSTDNLNTDFNLDINDIFKNQNNYSHIKENSKNFIKNNFTWSIYEKVYISQTERLINDNTN